MDLFLREHFERLTYRGGFGKHAVSLGNQAFLALPAAKLGELWPDHSVSGTKVKGFEILLWAQ